MINIYLGGDKISYTAGDTFLLAVGSLDGFAQGSRLKFCVAENEDSLNLIEKEFYLENEAFCVELTAEESDRLKRGEYIYKMVVINESGETETQKSGELTVKWGA